MINYNLIWFTQKNKGGKNPTLFLFNSEKEFDKVYEKLPEA